MTVIIPLSPASALRFRTAPTEVIPVLVATQNNAAIRLEVRVNLAPLKRDSFFHNL